MWFCPLTEPRLLLRDWSFLNYENVCGVSLRLLFLCLRLELEVLQKGNREGKKYVKRERIRISQDLQACVGSQFSFPLTLIVWVSHRIWGPYLWR